MDGLLVALIAAQSDYQAALVATLLEPWQELGPIGPAGPAANYPGGIGRVTQIDVYSGNGQVLLAGAAGGGVWRTDDGGGHWRPLLDGFDGGTLTIGAVAFASRYDASVVYAASGEDASPYDPAWPGAGIYRIAGLGVLWPPFVRVGRVESTRFSAIAVHPTNPDIVYVAGNRGFRKSSDGGLHWSTVWKGRITDVVVDHDRPERVYIGVYRQGIFRSTTAGEPPLGGFTLLSVDPKVRGLDVGYIKLAIGRTGAHRSQFIAAKLGRLGERLYTSTDGGSTWTSQPAMAATSPSFAEWTSVIAVSPTAEQRLYRGQRLILERSDDGGGTWSPVNQSLHPDHQDLVFDPANSDRLMLANDAGVYCSGQAGSAGSWQLVSGGLNIAQLYDLDISQQNSEIVACGAQESGVFYRDAAGNWTNFDYRWDGVRVGIDANQIPVPYTSRASTVGEAYLVAGRLEAARQAVHRALELFRRAHRQFGSEAFTLRTLGAIHAAQIRRRMPRGWPPTRRPWAWPRSAACAPAPRAVVWVSDSCTGDRAIGRRPWLSSSPRRGAHSARWAWIFGPARLRSS